VAVFSPVCPKKSTTPVEAVVSGNETHTWLLGCCYKQTDSKENVKAYNLIQKYKKEDEATLSTMFELFLSER
jgi:hypothetical protein